MHSRRPGEPHRETLMMTREGGSDDGSDESDQGSTISSLMQSMKRAAGDAATPDQALRNLGNEIMGSGEGKALIRQEANAAVEETLGKLNDRLEMLERREKRLQDMEERAEERLKAMEEKQLVVAKSQALAPAGGGGGGWTRYI